MIIQGYFFLFLHENICYEYSLEVSQRGTSNEYTQYVFRENWRSYTGIMVKYSSLTIPLKFPNWMLSEAHIISIFGKQNIYFFSLVAMPNWLQKCMEAKLHHDNANSQILSWYIMIHANSQKLSWYNFFYDTCKYILAQLNPFWCWSSIDVIFTTGLHFARTSDQIQNNGLCEKPEGETVNTQILLMASDLGLCH